MAPKAPQIVAALQPQPTLGYLARDGRISPPAESAQPKKIHLQSTDNLEIPKKYPGPHSTTVNKQCPQAQNLSVLTINDLSTTSR